jgi:hypothetical protein
MKPYHKRLETLLNSIYTEFPKMRRHPEYRFYYLYWGYPEPREFFIVITNLIPKTQDDEFLKHVNLMSQMYGFIEGTLMKPEDFEKHIKTPIEDSIKELRGSEFKTCTYEVW